MKKLLTLLLFLSTNLIFAQSADDEAAIKSIYNHALENGRSYEMLEVLTKRIGGRLSGSPQAAAAVEWSRQLMEELGFDKVWLQEVMVPHWERGKKEKGIIVNSRKMGSREVNVVALGNSVGTGPGGALGKVIEVQTFDELAALGRAQIEGKIVFFNRPMDPKPIDTFVSYGAAAANRSAGPSEAAKYGAIGAVVRSLSTRLDDVPHTGSTNYQLNTPKIPAVAISTNDAELLSTLLKDDANLEFYFETHSKMLEDKLSYNVIGEITGTEFPDKYIVVGGHLDSWDLGEGAHDDGAGCVQAIEVLRIFKELGIKPKHTIRAVMFMNEENGLRGGRMYAEKASTNNEKHVMAMESDRGGFIPKGFTIDANTEQLKKIQSWASLFHPYQVFEFKPGGGGADISPLKAQAVPLIGLFPDSQRYFDIHHTAEDTFDKVNKRELELGAALMAAMVYLVDKYGL
jgi:carboxypeptidase Q